MHLLMISLDTSVLTHDIGDSYARHREYARRLGQLSMIVYTPHPLAEHHAGELHLYPVYCPHPVFYPLLAFLQAWAIHRRQPADAVTTQEPFATGLVGVLLKLLAGLPLNIQNHSSLFHNPHWLAEKPLRHRLLHELGKIVLRFGNVHRVVNSGEKQRYLAMGIPADRIDVIQAPMAVQQFAAPIDAAAQTELRQQLGLKDAPTLLWVGRDHPVKRVEVLLEMFQQVALVIPETQLIVVGDFSKSPHLMASIQDNLKSQVFMVGRVPHDQLPAYYALADVYVITSIYEGMPRVIVEAMAAGKPVVSPRLDGALDVLRDGETGMITGFAAEELAQGVLHLLQNPDLAKKMGQQAHVDALKHFDRDQLIDQLMACFRRTAEPR